MTETAKSIQCLTFRLEDEIFAVEVSKVKSVLDLEKITKVPKTPDFMRGVINLRGSVVPIIDLRLKMGMSATDETRDTCVIVMEIKFDDQIIELGALADAVHEVIELQENQIEPPPSIGIKLDTQFLKGMGKQKDSFIIILDIDKVFSVGELSIIKGDMQIDAETRSGAKKEASYNE